MAEQKIQTIDFDKLVGLEASLYYNKDHSTNRFQLGSVIFEVIEDEDDGYRSSMQEVQIIDQNADRNPGDFLGIIQIRKNQFDSGNTQETWSLVDPMDNHCWLSFGTDNTDDYYPCFIFYYKAKPSIEEQKEEIIKKLIK